MIYIGNNTVTTAKSASYLGNVGLMEWNAGHNDIKFSEATQGPCFHDLGWEKFV